MKRFSSLVLLIALVAGTFAFADDATVLPLGVFRIRAIPSYSMWSQSYANNGTASAASTGNSAVTAMSGAAELSVMNPITFGLQWAPGYYVASSFASMPTGLASNTKMAYTGPADLQVGAKIQVVGSQGFVQNNQFRIALTPGMYVPLDSYKADTEWQNFTGGNAYRTMSASDHQSFGFVAKADADYQINDMFFVNLHGQALYFLPNDSVSFTTEATYYGTYAAVYAQTYAAAVAGGASTAVAASTAATNATAYATANAPLTSTKTQYGVNTFFEFEPHAKYSFSDTTNVSAGLPFSYTYNLASTTTYNGTSTTGNPESFLSVGPNVSFFSVIGPLPVEVEVQYVLPLMGQNSNATSTLSLQLKVFGKAF